MTSVISPATRWASLSAPPAAALMGFHEKNLKQKLKISSDKLDCCHFRSAAHFNMADAATEKLVYGECRRASWAESGARVSPNWLFGLESWPCWVGKAHELASNWQMGWT